jgi:hypothetical protein
MSTANPQALSAAAFQQQPANVTILMANMDPSTTWIVLPQSGSLWVGYEYQDQPAQQVYLWQQGGQTVQVPPGFNTFPVNEGDSLVYQLAYEGQIIKLGWGYE